MSKYTAEFTDVSQARDGQNGTNSMTIIDEPDRSSKGCFVSKKKGYLLAVSFVAVVVAVGVAVHYITKSRTDGPVYYGSGNEESPRGSKSPGVNDVTTPRSAIRPTDVRLPLNLIPIHYDVQLKPEFYGSDPQLFSFTGLTDIYINCIESTDVITLHSKNLTIDESAVRIEVDTDDNTTPSTNDAYRVIRIDEDTSREWIKIHLDKSLNSGTSYTIFLSFSANLTDSLSGLYLSSYKENNVKKWLVTSDLEPTDARKILPCFDEPAFKATFNVTIIRKHGYNALSNMPILESYQQGQSEWWVDRFQKSANMSTYLLAFIVCDFTNLFFYTQGQQRFTVYVRREALGQANYALQTGVRMHNYFENFFNISYPLPKQDLIAIPDFASGAMENWGLITFRETSLLFDEQASSISNKERVATVISHELAHQWFGNLVSPAWWDDLWLNEGFASYVEYLGVNHAEPNWSMMDLFVTNDLHRALALDSLDTSHPIYQPVQNPEEIREIFDSITYSKGASVIRMMHSFLGDETFRRGLTRYLRRHQYSNANHNDLWTSLSEQSRIDGTNIDVGDVMNTWVKQMGYPVVTVSRDNDQLILTQRHFLLNIISDCPHHPKPSKYRWKIPFTYVFGPSADWRNPKLHWMMEPSGNETHMLNTTRGTNDWLIGNVNQYGYYRVNYDDDNWMKLTNQLKTNHRAITVINRAQLVDDSFYIGRAGIINQTIGFRLIQYLTNESDYLPWEAASRHLYHFNTMLERTDLYGSFQKYASRLISPLYMTFNRTQPRSADAHTNKLLRSEIIGLACKFGNKDCLQQMKTQYRNWMNAPTRNQIKSDLRSMVYCHAIREGGLEEWEFAYRQYELSNVAVEKDRLLSAMSCLRHPWLLSRFINLAWKKLPKADTIYTLARIASEPTGRPLVWNYFRLNWNTIKQRYGESSFMLGRLFGTLTSAFNTEVELKELEQFKSENPNLGNMNRAYEQAVEKTRLQKDWLRKNEAKLREWLESVTQ